MTKAELVTSIAEKVNMTKNDVENILDTLLSVISDALVKREEVRLIGFGTFSTRDRKATMARNPQTGSPIEVAACVVPVFKPGKPLKLAVAHKEK
jgi:DNA-binding protein HU-beta